MTKTDICEANRRPCDQNRQTLVNAHRRIEDGLRREMALDAEVARRDAEIERLRAENRALRLEAADAKWSTMP